MTRPAITCPTFASIEIVTCEDGRGLIAYAYPNKHDEAGVVVVSLDDLPCAAFPPQRHLRDDSDADDW